MRKIKRQREYQSINPGCVLQDMDARLQATFADSMETEEQFEILQTARDSSRSVRLSTLAWLITANALMNACPHRAEQLLDEMDAAVSDLPGKYPMVCRVNRVHSLYLRLLYHGSRTRVTTFNRMMAETLVTQVGFDE